MSNFGSFVFLSILSLFSLILSWYVFQALKTVLTNWGNPTGKYVVYLVYWLLTGAYIFFIISSVVTISRTGEISGNAQMGLNIFLTVTITQATIILFLLGEDLFRGVQTGVNFFSSNVSNSQSYVPDRRKFISQMALLIAAVPFVGFVYGIIKGKYNFKVFKETLYFDDLPDAFDGFTITQLSDIHAGSFKDFTAVQRGVDLAREQNSDLFVFTGDLINVSAKEISPLVEKFKQINAPYGQFSILGNHDYGDYTQWSSPEEKVKNFADLKASHSKMGYRLLLDEHVTIEKDGAKIQLLGVENWGIGFKSKGDLEKALRGVNQKDFKILLSHDPSHWEKVVKEHPSKIHLTLSGHTHGMQMGVETPWIRWSPAKFRYPNWAGLAEQAGRYLYVNRGFGFHAFAGRVGIWPEITVIELKKKIT
ncbi:MAG TPA: metallophosphoesterase [Cyclobacteriaceae bacterium]|nr:metallophosphoesterase [Cyclobacteriaceae bacterium]